MSTQVSPGSDSFGFMKLAVIAGKLLSSFLKVAKSLKFLLAASTFGAYTFLFTWKFALLVMFGIGIHEMGHVWAMRHLGMKTKGFYFIPLIGGAAISDETFRSGKDEIFIALMGPTFGILTIIPAVIMYNITGYPIWAAAATWLAVINLFNLFPVNPLDGGRVVKSLAFALDNKLGWILLTAGFILSLVISWVLGLWLLVFITIIGMLDIRPFGKWCVLVPLSFAFNIVATPFVFGLGGDVNRWWVVWYKEFVKPEVPVMNSPFAKNSNHWVLTRQQILMFVGWYCGMIVLFVTLIMIFFGVPGADVGKMFLES